MQASIAQRPGHCHVITASVLRDANAHHHQRRERVHYRHEDKASNGQGDAHLGYCQRQAQGTARDGTAK